MSFSFPFHILTFYFHSHFLPSRCPACRSYDRFGEAGVEGRGFGGGAQFVDDFDIGDIFDSFFGGQCQIQVCEAVL